MGQTGCSESSHAFDKVGRVSVGVNHEAAKGAKNTKTVFAPRIRFGEVVARAAPSKTGWLVSLLRGREKSAPLAEMFEPVLCLRIYGRNIGIVSCWDLSPIKSQLVQKWERRILNGLRGHP